MADPTWSSRLVESLCSFQKRGYLCDMDIVASDGTVFQIHSCVMAAASTLYEPRPPTFTNTSEGSRHGDCVQTNIPSVVLPCAIQCMYTGKIKAEKEQFSMVQSALSELGIGDSSEILNRMSPSDDHTEPLSETEEEGTQLAESGDAFSFAYKYEVGSKVDAGETVAVEASKSTPPTADQQNLDSDAENAHKTRTKSSRDLQLKKCYKSSQSNERLQKRMKDEHGEHSAAGPLVCPLCGSKVKSKNSLAAHLRYIHQRAFGPDQEIVPIEGEVHQCQICMKNFHRKCHFKRHLLVHNLDRPYPCLVCSKSFKDRCALESHSKYMHEGRKRLPKTGNEDFWCSHCGKCFKHKGSLKVHERTHRGEKPFRCRYCPKAFTASSHRTKHEAIHKGKKDFQCATCGRRFTSSGILANHRYTHSDARPHACQICGKAFKQKSHKLRHEKLHENSSND